LLLALAALFGRRAKGIYLTTRCGRINPSAYEVEYAARYLLGGDNSVFVHLMRSLGKSGNDLFGQVG
jgi:hypothetical protein